MSELNEQPEFHGSLSSSEIVAQFGEEIKSAISEVAIKTPELAKAEAQKRAFVWYGTTLLISIVVSAATAWLLIIYIANSQHANHVTFRGPGNVLTTCDRTSVVSSTGRDFICRSTAD